jgi:hypothetical protein
LYWDLYVIVNEQKSTIADPWDGRTWNLLLDALSTTRLYLLDGLIFLCGGDGLNWLTWFKPSSSPRGK